MEPLPHRYTATATGGPEGPVPVSTDGRPTIETSRPAAFGGDAERWSPEELLMGAVADCFVLTFRALAAREALEWRHLTCDAEGRLERDRGQLRFHDIMLTAEVIVPTEAARADAMRCLDEAEQRCLVTASLEARVQLNHQVTVSAD